MPGEGEESEKKKITASDQFLAFFQLQTILKYFMLRVLQISKQKT